MFPVIGAVALAMLGAQAVQTSQRGREAKPFAPMSFSGRPGTAEDSTPPPRRRNLVLEAFLNRMGQVQQQPSATSEPLQSFLQPQFFEG